MSDRDELLKVMLDADDAHGPEGSMWPELADAILAAGYRKPRTITTAEELEALPDESVVRDSSGDVADKRGGVWCAFETAPMTNHRLAKYTPITVIWEPTP